MTDIERAPGFSAQDDLYFQRLDDGRVHVRILRPVLIRGGGGYDGHAVVYDTILPPNTWASTVASVCKRGDNAETFDAALAFHNVG